MERTERTENIEPMKKNEIYRVPLIKRVTFTMPTCSIEMVNIEIVDTLFTQNLVKESVKISDNLIDEMCILLEQFHITERDADSQMGDPIMAVSQMGYYA
jgi:hypothetical protein